jgi:hypothetical protein
MVHHVVAPAAQVTHGVVTHALARWYVTVPLVAFAIYLWHRNEQREAARESAVAEAARRAASNPQVRRDLERELGGELL